MNITNFLMRLTLPRVNRFAVDFVRDKAKNFFGQHFEEKSQLLQNTVFSYRRGDTDAVRFKITSNNITETDFS